MNRRTIISAMGAGSVIGLGGCTSFFDEETAVELLDVAVINWTGETTAVHIRVHEDDELVDEVTYELEPEDEGRVLDCTWPSEPGNFVISARLEDDDEWEKRDVTDPDADCAAVYLSIDRTVGSSIGISMLVSRDCEHYADRCEK